MPCLKLIAFDNADLAVLSAHMQNAVLRVADMAYVKHDMRFALVADRLDWTTVFKDGVRADQVPRRLAGLRFERVLEVKVARINLADKEAGLELLGIAFEAWDAPAGFVTLLFAGGKAVRLAVECLEAELTDLEAVWAARENMNHAPARPIHANLAGRT